MELLNLALLGLLIIISPGPNFVLVLKNSLQLGRWAGVCTAVGVSTSTMIHITYSIFGIEYIVSQDGLIFQSVKYFGATYLIYLGVKGLLPSKEDKKEEAIENFQSNWRCALQGWGCNILNPQTILFFVSIFSQIISPSGEDIHLAVFYGGYMILLSFLWFTLVAVMFTSEYFQARLMRVKTRVEQICGVALVSFGTLVMFS